MIKTIMEDIKLLGDNGTLTKIGHVMILVALVDFIVGMFPGGSTILEIISNWMMLFGIVTGIVMQIRAKTIEVELIEGVDDGGTNLSNDSDPEWWD